MKISNRFQQYRIFSRASYENGRLKGPIKPCAGNNGTQITVEDLFYTVTTRKRALLSPTDEYAHIMEVVGGYAIHNNHVSFTLKKFGENTDLKTPMNSSVIDNVRIVSMNLYIMKQLWLICKVYKNHVDEWSLNPCNISER